MYLLIYKEDVRTNLKGLRHETYFLFRIILHYKYTIYSIDWKYKKSHDYNLIFFKNMSEKYCFEIFKKNLKPVPADRDIRTSYWNRTNMKYLIIKYKWYKQKHFKITFKPRLYNRLVTLNALQRTENVVSQDR